MPIYEYRCEACGAKEEKLQPLSAPPEHACPQCGAEQGMRRQISRTGFTLSGGGWYAQGYGDGGGASSGATSVPEASTPKAEAGGCSTGCACHSPVVKKATENV